MLGSKERGNPAGAAKSFIMGRVNSSGNRAGVLEGVVLAWL